MSIFRDAQKKQAEYAKNLMGQIATGQAGREEGAQLQQAQTAAANQAIQAQQAMLNQQAMQQSGGGPVSAGANVEAAQAASKAAADAAVESTGAAKDFQQKVFENQQAVAMAAMDTATKAELEKREQDMALTGGILEVAGGLVMPV